MKLKIIIASITIISLFVYASCNKSTQTTNTEIVLKDKSLSEIKNAILGRWQLHYAFGGLLQRVDYNKNYIEFYNFSDSIKWTDNGSIYALDRATYSRIRSVIYGDSTYLITFYAPNAQYWWTVDRIKNDTLILKDEHSNPFTYYLTRK